MATATRKRKRTAAEKLAWRAKMQAAARTVRAMTQEERSALVARMGCITTCEGHPLSLYNTCFLLAQTAGREPSMVAGFRQWKKAGRCVRKGEHACGHIYVPKMRKPKDDEDPEPNDSLRGFLLVPVFDVAQTDETE